MSEGCRNDGSRDRQLTGNDVDNVVHAILDAQGQLTLDMQLVLEAYNDKRINASFAVDYLLRSEADGATDNQTSTESVNS